MQMTIESGQNRLVLTVPEEVDPDAEYLGSRLEIEVVALGFSGGAPFRIGPGAFATFASALGRLYTELAGPPAALRAGAMSEDSEAEVVIEPADSLGHLRVHGRIRRGSWDAGSHSYSRNGVEFDFQADPEDLRGFMAGLDAARRRLR